MERENTFYTEGPTYTLNECFPFQVSFILLFQCCVVASQVKIVRAQIDDLYNITRLRDHETFKTVLNH